MTEPCPHCDQERIAELQYEAGMYKSLYENAVAQGSPDCGALRATLEDIIAVYEWCSVDAVDRGYSALDNEIHRAKSLLAGPSVASSQSDPAS